jgi:phosphoglucomutase
MAESAASSRVSGGPFDVEAVRRAYYTRTPDMLDGSCGVRFGPHGHRGSALHGTFTEAHVMAVVQAICDNRRHDGVSGPLFIIRDSQVLSEPAFITAVEVLAANGIATIVDQADRCTPTPLLSHAILTHNRGRTTHPADGIVITTSSGASEDGGIAYQLPTGAPADAEAAGRINRRANRQLADRLRRVSRVPYERAGRAGTIQRHDFVDAYVGDLASLVDIDAIRRAGLRIGIDSTGTGAACWAQIADEHGIDIERLSHGAAPHREPAARVDLAVVVNADACEYRVATRGAGAMPASQVLAATIFYLFMHRRRWPGDLAVGKTIVSSRLIDRVAAQMGRPLVEVACGFDRFASRLLDGTLAFAADDRGSATFVRRNGDVWTTDRDGIAMSLLAAEVMARTDRDPGDVYTAMVGGVGVPAYERIDVPATADERDGLVRLSPGRLGLSGLAGDAIEEVRTTAPADGAAFGGVKVATAHGWFAARAAAIDPTYALYAESFRGPDHLRRIQEEAVALVRDHAGARRTRV